MNGDADMRGGAPQPGGAQGRRDRPREESLERSGEGVLRRGYLWARTVVRWTASGLFFFTVCPALVVLGMLIDPRGNDGPQRWLSRNIVRLAGARVKVRFSPGFDTRRTSFFVSNHVNLFDPFVLYGTVPQFVRGLELESHFRIPAYGWMMKRFGNVPVPEGTRPSDLKRMWRLARTAVNSGVSLIVFPEGKRTITGRVGEFHDGGFRMAQQFGVPVVPVSMVGSFEFNRKTSWLLRPATIVVYFHDTIETAMLDKSEVPGLRERVREIIAAPIHAAIDARAPEAERSAMGTWPPASSR
jgi:1-acyl-sn-glycerol-3-phosphate acyltransferase